MLNNCDLTKSKAIILTVNGAELSKDEEALYKAYRPAGFILFQRSCVSRNQVKDLVSALRSSVGCDDLPILIDQEGGKVSRLKSPEWKEFPSARYYFDLAKQDAAKAERELRANYASMAQDLAELGINVNCTPVMDLPSATCHEFLVSRTYGDDVESVVKYSRIVCDAMLTHGITPVIKHIPGHGRAEGDTHYGMPTVHAERAELEKSDFATFARIAKSEIGKKVWAMSAHVMFDKIDDQNPATFSRKITDEVIRGFMGFDGVMLTDCLSMRALNGSVGERIKRAMGAGMDLAMLTNSMLDDGKIAPVSLSDREKALETVPFVSDVSANRIKLSLEK